ncbi:hypothetical protein [Microbacterium gilvum]|uniref:Uncharacterized protein n=1 Tax=Microbacterium gilvum TaxID=1336204 RepID=A0ABP9A6G4_9MICO
MGERKRKACFQVAAIVSGAVVVVFVAPLLTHLLNLPIGWRTAVNFIIGAANGYFAVKWIRAVLKANKQTKSKGKVHGDFTIHPHVQPLIGWSTPPGGHWGGTQAHRVGTFGGAGNGSSGSGRGTGARMNLDEFSGKTVLNLPELEDVGFSAGVVRGVRSFRVDKLGRLTGVHHKQIWTPGENEAMCRAVENESAAMSYAVQRALYQSWGTGTRPVEPAREYRQDAHTMADCKHGFYAYYDGSDDYSETGMVSAVVEGYGETVIGTRGFRCMKARIVALTFRDDVPAHLVAKVKRNYPDVPVLDSFDRMVAEFPPDGAGNEYTPENDPDFWTRSI